MSDDGLYTALSVKAKEHAALMGMSERWAYGFLNALWPTINAAVVAASSPSMSGEDADVAS